MDSTFCSGDRKGDELKFDLSDRFSNDMLKMFREGSFNDVCIKLHDGEIKANKSVLAARCEYFAAAFRWKDNNNQKVEVEKIGVNDCSKKIMTRIIEYIFTGILNANDLNLLEFLELKDQIRKMFPGDKLEGQIEDILKINDDRYFSPNRIFNILPTNKEIANAFSLVENGNLQSEVMAELARAIESLIWHEKRGVKNEERTRALASLVSYGVIVSVQHLKVDLRHDPPGDHLQELIPRVTGTIDISNIIKGHNLRTILDGVNCKELHMFTERLNQEETEALVRAMTARVKKLCLKMHHEWDMDYDTFSKYKGDGKCTELHIHYYSDYYLSTLLDSVNCKELHLFTGSKDLILGETEALVRAMTSRVEILHLGGSNDEVTLHFDILKLYKGDGKCREVHCHSVCIGWSWFDDHYEYEYFDEDDRKKLIVVGDGYILGMKDKWFDDESAETWAEQMNWDLQVKIQNCEYLLSRKKKV